MPNVEKVSVALTGEQVALLKTAVDTGEYATTSEIVREALRDWQHKRELHHEDVQRLRSLWAQGKKSGPAVTADMSEVRRSARERLTKVVSEPRAHAG